LGTGFGAADAAGGVTVTLGWAVAAGGAGISGEAAGAGLVVVTGGLMVPVGAAGGFAVGVLDALAAVEDEAAGVAGGAVGWFGICIGCGCVGAG
jgi:hypothetical protein